MTTELLEIRNYGDVCKKLGIRQFTTMDFIKFPREQRKKLLAVHKIHNIAKLFNGDWKIKWEDYNQRKWYPYFTTDPDAGLGCVFDGSSYHYGDSYGQVSFYKDEATSDHCGKLFIEIYLDLFTNIESEE